MPRKQYDYPTGNVELAIRLNRGEPLPVVMNDIKTKWMPGNEYLWDDYDLESLINTPEKQHYLVNKLLYSRVTVYRALRECGKDIRGTDPFSHGEEVPDVMAKLKIQFPSLLK